MRKALVIRAHGSLVFCCKGLEDWGLGDALITPRRIQSPADKTDPGAVFPRGAWIERKTLASVDEAVLTIPDLLNLEWLLPFSVLPRFPSHRRRSVRSQVRRVEHGALRKAQFTGLGSRARRGVITVTSNALHGLSTVAPGFAAVSFRCLFGAAGLKPGGSRTWGFWSVRMRADFVIGESVPLRVVTGCSHSSSSAPY